MRLLRRSYDLELLELFEESGRTVQRATMLLRDVLNDYPERADLANDLVICENEGDRITHDIIHRLGAGKVRAPFDFADGYALATALDDVVDYAEQTADTLGVYHVEAPMEQADRMCDVLVGAGEQVAQALRGLRTGNDVGPALVEIHHPEYLQRADLERIYGVADAASRQALLDDLLATAAEAAR